MKVPIKITLMLVLILASMPARAFGEHIEFGSVSIVDDKLRVSFAVVSYQRKDILEAIKRGIEVKILYEIQVYSSPRLFFMGTRVAYDKSILRSVKFDFWSKAFQVKEGQKKILFRSENAMLDYFFSVRDSELVGAHVIGLEGSGVRARAELKTVEFYFPMNLIFKYLVRFWDFETGWVKGPALNLQQLRTGTGQNGPDYA